MPTVETTDSTRFWDIDMLRIGQNFIEGASILGDAVRYCAHAYRMPKNLEVKLIHLVTNFNDETYPNGRTVRVFTVPNEHWDDFKAENGSWHNLIGGPYEGGASDYVMVKGVRWLHEYTTAYNANTDIELHNYGLYVKDCVVVIYYSNSELPANRYFKSRLIVSPTKTKRRDIVHTGKF